MNISRLFTKAGTEVYDLFTYTKRSSTLRNPDGSVVFEMHDIEVPEHWSQMATDILAQKYFRKAGVPQYDADGNQLFNESGEPILGSETSARQVVHRLAGCWRHWGEEHGYFDSEEDAQAFYDEIAYMLMNQMCAPNSPQWFNTGLNWAYGITGPAQGHYYVDPESGKLTRSKDAYTHPAPHACFIQSVADDLVNEGGIFDLVTREARIFKYGSGCTAGDSRIWVSGEGFIPIADLFERFRSEGRTINEFDGKGRYIEIADAGLDTLSVNEETGAYQRDRIVRVWSYDVAADDKRTVSFDTGARSTVSAWHPFLVWDGSQIVERRADQLVRGDAVIGPNRTAFESVESEPVTVTWQTTYFRKEEEWSAEIDTDLAWLCGYFLGDGSLGMSRTCTTNAQGKSYEYRRLRLRFHDETVEVLDRVREIIERKFGESATIQQDGRGSNGKHLCYTGRKVTGFFEKLFGAGPKTYALSMPEFIRTADRTLVLAFLAGLVDSDGTVSEGRATYATASTGFAGDVAVLASFHGLGGGRVLNGSTTQVSIVRRSTLIGPRREFAGYLVHPARRAALLLDDRPHERAFCMPLDIVWQERLFGGDHAAGDWLAMPVGDSTVHLGRLKYEGIVNPVKLVGVVEAIAATGTSTGATAEQLEFIGRVAESVAFVTGVGEPADDPDFYDLTVARHSNYLAGEEGLVAIHNTGSNFSNLRGEGEPLSGGGVSSGLMSFLKINDRAAGAVKSGGTTRRAAKMVILNADHPDIEKFIDWKMIEEQKVAAMVAGSKVCSTFLEAISEEARVSGTDFSDPDSELHSLVQRALSRGIPFNYIARVLALVEQGIENIDFREYDLHYEGEAYNTVSGQNSNNSIRLSNEFMKRVKEDSDWGLISRTTGETIRTVKARYLWNKINYAAWSSADPGIQYDTTINEWHTSPKEGRINGSNPCVTADTFVTTDRGLERIGDLVGQARGVKSLDGQLHWVEKIFPTGTKPVYEMKTKSGYRMKLTGDHRVFTENRGDVQACELTKDDVVRLMPGEFGNESTGSADTAGLIGLLVGDGCITQQNIFTRDGDQREVAFLTCSREEEGIAAWANDVVNRLRPEFSEKQKMGNVVETATSLRVQSGSPRMLELFREFAVLDERSTGKRLTDRAFRLNRDEQAALLRGLFTADGTVANYGEKSQYVALDSTSLELLTQVQLLLLNFGIKAKIYENRRAGKTTAFLPDGNGGMKEYEVKEMHSLRISRTSRILFEKEIGFLPASPKNDALRELNETVGAYADQMVDPVASLEYLGQEPVFDLTEPETSHFAANGIIVHNCSEYLYLDDTACVAPETRISTPEGLRTVEELFAIQETGKRVMITTDIHSEQDHRRLTAHRPAYITKVGEKQTYRIETKDGRVIRATEEHRFLTDDGQWKRIDQLEVGSDRIEVRESGNTIAYTSSEDDVRRYQALGWLTGDGVFSKGSVAMVFGPQEEATGRAMEVEFNRMLDDAYRWIWNEESSDNGPEEGGSDGILRDPHLEYSWTVGDSGAMVAEPYVTSRGVTLGRQASGVYQMTSKSTALVRYLEEVYGCTQGTAVYKDVPKAVFTAPDDLKAAYLGGLFSADGCLRKSATEKEVMLASSSKELLRSVQLLLSDLGIVGRISWMHPTGRKNPQGQLHLHNQQARKFLALIGFPCSEPKNAEAEKIRSTEFTASRCNPRPVTVVSIERDEVTTVYDITEPVTRSFIAEGMITHNCNLASLNLSHFYDTETEVFDVEAFKHASRLWTVVLEISVLMAQFPSKIIAQKSFETRTLGLGYANLGTVLMTAGIPYDSDEGRNWASAITAVMTGEAYATSAELARDKGAFAKYQRNAKDMLRVIRNHRRAAYNAPEGEYEGLTVTPVGLESDLCPANLAAAAKETWDRALELGEQYGYRNAQVTVIAPTGTISLVMDCDTTGIEPDFALVKYKKLAGGGYFKIVNQSVPKALKKLGYTDAEIADITGYIRGYASLRNCPHINRESLKAKGFTDEKVDAIESQLDTVFDIAFAFNHHTLGEEFLESLGFPPAVSTAPNFNLLEALGFTKEELAAANRYVCGTMMIEGAPGLREEHLPIFDCANRCGKEGKRYIDYMGHVKMMAAAQPFISGAISKTINMPREATLEDVERVYMESWRLMVKAIALYRDGSKLSQPLNVSSDLELVDEVTLRDVDLDAAALIGDENDWNENVSPALVQEKIVERVYHRTERRRLPKRRHGFVREANVGGHKVFLRTGEYEDGSIGEIFIDMYKEGASFKGLLNCFAVLASKALQYGMPLEKMVDTFTFTRFEPAGAVQGHEAIKNATSIIDYVFRAIGYEYLGREDFVHVKAVDETEGIEYGSDEEGGDAPTGKLSPGQELWERQKSHRKQIRKGGQGGSNGNGHSNGNGNGNGGGHANGSTTSVGAKIAAARSVAKEVTVSEAEAKVATAKAHGYTGEQCGNCGSMRVKQNGACHVCEECGTTSGCS